MRAHRVGALVYFTLTRGDSASIPSRGSSRRRCHCRWLSAAAPAEEEEEEEEKEEEETLHTYRIEYACVSETSGCEKNHQYIYIYISDCLPASSSSLHFHMILINNLSFVLNCLYFLFLVHPRSRWSRTTKKPTLPVRRRAHRIVAGVIRKLLHLHCRRLTETTANDKRQLEVTTTLSHPTHHITGHDATPWLLAILAVVMCIHWLPYIILGRCYV